MATVRMSTKGQIVIPAEIRKRRGWAPGTKVVIEETDGGLVLRSVEELIDATYGMLKDTGMTMKDFLADRAEDRALEERKLQRWLDRPKKRAAAKQPNRDAAG